MTFEVRLADAYERYLAGAPVDVDARTLAATVANAAPRRGWSLAMPAAGPKRQIAMLGILALLLVATIATVLLVGQLRDRRQTPWVYTNEVIDAPSLPGPRGNPTVVALADGRVLILGTEGGSGETIPLVFDPASGATQATGPFATPGRLSIARGVALRDGRVMVVGTRALDDGRDEPVVELLDIRTLRFHALGPMVVPRVNPSVALLGDGRVLIAGGVPNSFAGTLSNGMLRSIEAYDPATNSFDLIAELPFVPYADRRFESLSGGKVGVLFDDLASNPTEVRLGVIDPVTNAFIEVATGVPGSPAGNVLPSNGSLVPLADGRVLIVGDVIDANGDVVSGAAVLWDPSAGTFAVTRSAPWQYSGAIELDDGRLLLLGLDDPQGPSDDPSIVGTFDLDTGDSAVLPGLAACHPAAVKLRDGRVAFIGGLEDCRLHGQAFAPPVPLVQIFQ